MPDKLELRPHAACLSQRFQQVVRAAVIDDNDLVVGPVLRVEVRRIVSRYGGRRRDSLYAGRMRDSRGYSTMSVLPQRSHSS